MAVAPRFGFLKRVGWEGGVAGVVHIATMIFFSEGGLKSISEEEEEEHTVLIGCPAGLDRFFVCQWSAICGT